MSSLVWWMAQQVTRQAFATAAANPAETSLAFVLLANPNTRGFTVDVLKSVFWRGAQMSGRIALDVGKSAVARSTVAARLSRWAGGPGS